jgi:hypothetical protein
LRNACFTQAAAAHAAGDGAAAKALAARGRAHAAAMFAAHDAAADAIFETRNNAPGGEEALPMLVRGACAAVCWSAERD